MALYDVMPTLAELAGAPVPMSDGISFAPELRGKPNDQKKHEFLYWENGTRLPHGQAVRFGPWYAMREHPNKPLRLFDVEQDPACARDLATGSPQLVARAKAIFAEAHVDSDWYVNPGEQQPSPQQ
jgi:arylsulfatase A-like enzyme